MRICAAQTKPAAGDVETNLLRHRALIDLAVSHDADLVFFPELSLTGYEPKLAKGLATGQDDSRLDGFQDLADAHDIIIGIGLPTTAAADIRISMIIFQPRRTRLTYSKQWLHPDELPFFAHGDEQIIVEAGGHIITPAICYESLQISHVENAAKVGADIYLASAAKGNRQLTKAYAHYPAMAKQHSLTVLMANCIGPCDDFIGMGQSAVWNSRGGLVAKMGDAGEGVVMIDTVTGDAGVYGLWPADMRKA